MPLRKLAPLPPTAHQHILDSLRTAIVRREILPGEAIPANTVAEQFGVSRIPVREALRVLEAEGLVTSEPHKGVVVSSMSVVDLHEIYLLRRILETEATRRGIASLSRPAIEALQRLVEEMDVMAGRADPVRMSELNRAFHFAIYDASGLDRLVGFVRILWNQSDSYRALYLADEASRRRVQDEHHAVLAAAKARDEETVIRLLDEHRSRAEATIADMLRGPDLAALPPATD
jgi:DNA-binding GntR family transcriptional regulator